MKHRWISMPASTILAIGLVLVLTIALASAYTERITNGSFDTDVSGWSDKGTGGSIAYEASIGHNATGSAKVTNASGQNTSSGAVQCVDIPLSGGTSYYTVKGWIYIPPGQPANFSHAYIRVQYYSQDGCSGTLGSTLDSNSVTTVESWQEAVKITLAPDSAQSAHVRLYIRTTGSGGSPFVYFDDVTFYDSTATAVTLTSLSARSGQTVTQLEHALTAMFRRPIAVVARLAFMLAAAGLTIFKRRRPH